MWVFASECGLKAVPQDLDPGGLLGSSHQNSQISSRRQRFCKKINWLSSGSHEFFQAPLSCWEQFERRYFGLSPSEADTSFRVPNTGVVWACTQNSVCISGQWGYRWASECWPRRLSYDLQPRPNIYLHHLWEALWSLSEEKERKGMREGERERGTFYSI